MRYRLLFIGALTAACVAVTTVDQALAAVQPVVAPAYADSLVTTYDVSGIKVIQRRALSGDVAALRIYLLGGSRQVDAANAGVEPLMLMASEYGTKNYPGNALRGAQARTGSTVVVATEPDWTSLSFVGLASDFDSTLAIVGDRIANPTLDSASIAVAKNRALVTVRLRSENPSDAAVQLAESLAFAGHPYANNVDGTVESLTALTPAAVSAFHKAQVVKSRLLVVVAGNVTRAQVEAGIQRSLGSLPAGNYTWTLPDRWLPKTTAIAARRQQIPTSYIAGIFSGPLTSSKDLAALQMGMGILGAVINGPMRDSGLSYGADASVLGRAAAGGVITVSTGSPDRAMRIINDRIELLSKAQFPPGYFTSSMNDYARSYQHRMETSIGQVDALAESYLLHGDYRYFEEFGKELRQLTGEDMTRALRAYVKNIQWAYIGDTLKLPRALMTKY
jgi:zinc protease